jgi:cytochrome b
MRTYIWTLPTRLFHWLLAISFTVAFILGGEEKYLSLHAALGSLIGGLVFFRILQGFFGPKYARFRDFPVAVSSIISFVSNMRQSKAAHPGHNPLAALIMFAIIATALLSSLSGMLMFAAGDTGIFGWRINPGVSINAIEEVHDVVVHLFLILVGIHLTGILADTVFHGENGTIWSVFNGYKRIKAVPATPTPFQKWFALCWFGIPVFMFFYVLIYQPVPVGGKDKSEQVGETDENED